MKPTDLKTFVADLNGGVFSEQIEAVLSLVALAVTSTGKQGEVNIKFKMKPINNGNQVNITHELKFSEPRKRGVATESDSSDTAMYVNQGGELTFFPKNQGQIFDKKGNITPANANQE